MHFIIKLFLILLFINILPASTLHFKTASDFGIEYTAPGEWSCRDSSKTMTACINPDHFQDVITLNGQRLEIYINRGNGTFGTQPDLKVELTGLPESLQLKQNQRFESLANIKYANGTDENFNLTRLYMSHICGAVYGCPAQSAIGDSLNFNQVWSWEFPINWGSNAMTAGDLDNDGRVEIISSMTDTMGIEHGWIIIYESIGDNTYQHDLTIEVNFHAWFHRMKITDWDQDGNKELTCAVDRRIKIWEFYGDKNYRYFDTNISMGDMKASSGIEAVDTDRDNKLELLSIFINHDGPWRSRIVLYEFYSKSINPAYFSFNIITQKTFSCYYYSFAAGDMDNDGWLDLLPGYAQLWPPSPNTLYYEEYDPVNKQFISRTFHHPYPIDPSFSVIDDLDGDGLNDVFITGVGGGYGGVLYMKSDFPDHYQILFVDSTLYNTGGSTVKTAVIDGEKYITKADAYFDYNLHLMFYSISILKRQFDNNFVSVWNGPSLAPETYLHQFEIIDSDHDSKENILYKISSPIRSLNDIEKTTVSGIEPIFNNPTTFILYQNYPNPFNSETIIQFYSPKLFTINFQIFDIQGRLIRQYLNIKIEPGLNNIRWNGSNEQGNPVSSGVYFYRLVHKQFTQTKKMILIR